MEKKKTKNKNVINYNTEEQKEVIKLLVIIVVIVALVVGEYFLTRAFVTKDLKSTNEEQPVAATINYDVTIIGSLLNRPYDEYYALVYDSTDISVNKYQAVYSSYATLEKKDKTKMYYIDLSNTMNKSYYTEEKSNPDAKNLEELKLGDFTLIKVKKGKIVKYIEDYDAVKKELGIED